MASRVDRGGFDLHASATIQPTRLKLAKSEIPRSPSVHVRNFTMWKTRNAYFFSDRGLEPRPWLSDLVCADRRRSPYRIHFAHTPGRDAARPPIQPAGLFRQHRCADR